MTTVCKPAGSDCQDDVAGYDGTISTTRSINDYFRTAVCDAIHQERLDIGEDTLWYLTQLFSNYHRTDRLFDYDAARSSSPTRPLTPLAEYYRLAVEADTAGERRLYLQKLGDVAIFITSLYAGALKRKPVGIGYYIAMGESAYGCLADAPATTTRHRALAGIFEELSREFASLVPALGLLGRQVGTDVPASDERGSQDAALLAGDHDRGNADVECDTPPGLILPSGAMLH